MKTEQLTDHIVRKGDKTYFSFDLVHKLLTVYELNHSQAITFMAIADKLAKEDGNIMSMEKVANLVKMNRVSVTQNCNVLQDKGLVERWIPEHTNVRANRWSVSAAV